MKKLVLIICIAFAYTNATYSAVLAEPVCPKVMEPIIDSRHTIEMWGDDYVPCVYQEWYLIFPEERQYVEINYTIDLNLIGAIDFLWIYVLDDNNKEVDILGYNYQPMSGKKTVKLNGGSARVVLLSESGNSGELYRGFKLSFDFANDGIQNSEVIYSNLGIGIQPEERLHVNGAVRGDGANGSLRIRTTTGTTEIGSSSADYSHFYTDRQAFFFNKPLYINGGIISSYGTPSMLRFRINNTDRLVIDNDVMSFNADVFHQGEVNFGKSVTVNGDIQLGDTTKINGNIHLNGDVYGPKSNNEMLKIRTSYGYTDIGAVNSGYSHFYTDRPGFYFNQPITINTGMIRSAIDNNLYLNTFSETRMIILNSNGYVGIGTMKPQTKLHVDGALKIGLTSDYSSRSENMIYIGDGKYIQIGEWEEDNVLSFKANSYNFTNGRIGVNQLNPQYELDVNGTINATRILVQSPTGADFVFDEDYHLPALGDVKEYIEENNHLPEIPSAEEMQSEGVDINTFQIKLLQKIEELTLYIIEQDNTIRGLQKEVELLKNNK